MLVHDKPQRTDETTAATARPQSPTPTALAAADAPVARRAAHRPWRRVFALVGTSVLFGIATIVAVNRPDQDATDPGSVSDRSFEVAEVNRFRTLRDLTTGSVSDRSFEVAEVNRFRTLRYLTTGSVSDRSFEVAEVNRFKTLRDLTTGS
jgi:hypothetical protein